MNLTQTANLVFSILTVIGQLMIVSVLFGFLTKNKNLLKFFGKNVLLLSFGVALISTLGSLFYSEIARFEPCKLCWYQRILMYPQTLLFGLALWKKRHDVVDYAIALSGVGALISTYHYLLQLGVVKAGDCAAIGYSVSCAKRFVLEFGYITIPMMALTGFLMIVAFGLAYKNFLKK